MSFKEKNLDILKKIYSFDPEKKSFDYGKREYLAETTKTGDPTVSFGGKYIHSRYNPSSEADKIIRSSFTPGFDCWVFGGFGLGYHIESYLRCSDEGAAVVVEPDVDLFIKAVELRDLSEILMSGRVILIVGTDADSVVTSLNMFQFEKIKFFQMRSEYLINMEYFDSLQKSVASYVARKEINNNTLIRFGKMWVKNLCRNLKVFSDSPGIDLLKNRFKNIPALILAGGPGLDRELSMLKKYREKCIIIAVDTSMSACLRSGVEPDFLVIVDPQYWNFRHLDRCRSGRTVIVSEPSTYSGVFRGKGRRYVFGSSVFPLGRIYEDKTYHRGKIGAGGSVSTTAWDFARIAGCSPVIFAGLDLSYPSKMTHFRGSFFEHRSHTFSYRLNPAAKMDFTLLNDAVLIKDTDNEGNPVFTDNRLVIYRKWFEEQHKIHSIKTLTLSEQGIRIEGISLTDRNYIKSLPDSREKIESILENISDLFDSRNEDREVYREITIKIISLLKDLKGISDKGNEMCIEFLSSDGSSNHELLKELDSIDRMLLEGEARDLAGFLLQEVSRRILTDEKETDLRGSVIKSMEIYINLSESALYHISLLENALKNLV